MAAALAVLAGVIGGRGFVDVEIIQAEEDDLRPLSESDLQERVFAWGRRHDGMDAARPAYEATVPVGEICGLGLRVSHCDRPADKHAWALGAATATGSRRGVRVHDESFGSGPGRH